MLQCPEDVCIGRNGIVDNGKRMKIALPLLIACALMILSGCGTDRSSGGVGPAYETTAGRGVGLENDQNLTTNPQGAWESWRYGGDTDRIPPRLPVNPNVPPPPPRP